MKTSLMVVLSCVLLLSANPCLADVTNYCDGTYLTDYTKVGQSWTADSDGIVESITVDFGSGTATSVTLFVYSGSGASGQWDHTQSVSISQTGVTTIPLDGTVTVKSGEQYTFILGGSSEKVYLKSSPSSTYDGGNLFVGYTTVSSIVTRDLYFGINMASSGAATSAVPAATPWQYGLLALLLAGCGLAALRRYRRS